MAVAFRGSIVGRGTPSFSVSATTGWATANPVAGDVLFCITMDNDDTSPGSTVSGGWTRVASVEQVCTTGITVFELFWRVWQNTDTTYTVTSSGGISSAGAVFLAFSGVNTTTPIDASGSTLYDFSTVTAVVAPSVTTANAASYLVCGFLSDSRTGAQSFTTPAGMTNHVNANAVATPWYNFSVNGLALAAAGATGTKTSTYSTASANTKYALSFAIQPPAPAIVYPPSAPRKRSTTPRIARKNRYAMPPMRQTATIPARPMHRSFPRRGPRALFRRGRMFFPVPSQTVVVQRKPTSVSVPRRGLRALLRRGRSVLPVPTQTAPVAPRYVPTAPARRSLRTLFRRPKVTTPILVQDRSLRVAPERPVRVRPVARTRVSGPPIAQVVAAAPTRVPQTRPVRQLRALVRRAVTTFPWVGQGVPTPTVVAGYFTPPYYEARRRTQAHTAYSVIKRGSVYTQIMSPSRRDVEGADFVYVGGHVYFVDDAEATLLTAAGYTITATIPS